VGKVLLTGATGFVSAHVAAQLLKETEHSIIALVRGTDKETATRRLSRTWWDWPELAGAIGGRVKVAVGDVSESMLGLSGSEYQELVETLTHIIHTAADLRLDAPIEELRKTNVGGTINVLNLARAVHKHHGLTRLSHVSTAYVAGGRTGDISEASLSDEAGFYSKYEVSKYEAERLVQQEKSELPVSVFRPGLVVGDSRTGAIKTFNTLYFPLKLYLNKRPTFVPIDPSIRVNMVPVDYVANAIAKLTFNPEAAGLNFHLVTPWDKLPSVRQLIEFLGTWATERLGMKLPRPVFLPMPVPATRARYKAQGKLNRESKSVLDALLTIVPYFNESRRFRRDNIDRLLGPYDFRWQNVFKSMMDYAVSKGFLHRSERTVYEQLMFRLKSKSMPVTYCDIVEGKIIKHDTSRVREEILATAGAMRSMGIVKGDRVALVGLNSTSYLTIDVAIGLLGAVSVPLYNTSPPAEIEQILTSSSAKLLFVGVPSIIARLDEMAAAIPVISFCRKPPEHMPTRTVTGWEEFLSLGKNIRIDSTAPVIFSDLATIRYTSGTTGQVKGVCFDHENLRWLAEITCDMMNSWRAQNVDLTYVSYLPMNHVVEGIIATYSAYYAPSPFLLYSLEDINYLPATLRKIRPHVFFSVPRLYEKIWESLLKSPLGRKYIHTREGAGRNFLRFILRRGVLKKAGLDRCAQLIVGSASISEDLLRNFRDLGIEVYNGYGLTEAPLVTINRLNENRIDTVGVPLPHTIIDIAEDGEIIVHGPQVARGYLNGHSLTPFSGGNLHTGDLGYMTDSNSLVLHGRKKDIIVTSYGKNIHPIKIEAMLRGIPGVSEALMIGESKPFCAAIIWADRANQELISSIDGAIKKINAQLSHPEQMKRWAILTDHLSIEKGEITASLKLKRFEVQHRLSNIVDALYSGKSPSVPPGIHFGRMEAEL
jgi:long-chain acyl-CoA synthetase